MKLKNIKTEIGGVEINIEALIQRGKKPPVLFLHGFGSSKEEYADVVHLPEFSDRAILAYDSPGSGKSTCSDFSKVTIDFFVRTAEKIADYFELDSFHLGGHSMGGLTALKFSMQFTERVISFIDIEGNLAPEDCFFSRQIIEAEGKTGREFLQDLQEGIANNGKISERFYATNLPHKIHPEVIEPIFKTIVDLSDNEKLLEQFLNLPFPKMFVYGDRNRNLSYLEDLRQAGVEMAEIPFSGHFPMYSNPHVLWRVIGAFIEKVEDGKDE